MRLRISLSVPQSGGDRLIYISLFFCHFKLENVMTACSVISLAPFFFYLLEQCSLNFKTPPDYFVHVSLLFFLPADYFTLHWALFVLIQTPSCCFCSMRYGGDTVTLRRGLGSDHYIQSGRCHHVVNNGRDVPLGEYTWVQIIFK